MRESGRGDVSEREFCYPRSTERTGPATLLVLRHVVVSHNNADKFISRLRVAVLAAILPF
jgi:hypothetical protein